MVEIKVKKIGLFLISIVLHLVAIATLLVFFYPVASWYYSARPLFGVDFFNTVSLVTILKQNLTLPPMTWLPAWFGGWPYISLYPVLHFYAILPFSFFFSIIDSTLLWMIICTCLFFVGMYLFFWSISSSRLLSLVLTIAAIYSVGVYGALLWGGSLPFYATQAFFPWVLWLTVRFIQSNNRRFLLSAALLSGLAIWGHPQIVLTYIYPGVLILLLFGSSEKIHLLHIKKKILSFLTFVIISFVIGLPLYYQTIATLPKNLVLVGGTTEALSTVRVDSGINDKIEFNRNQPFRIFKDTHLLFFVALGMIGGLSLLTLFLKLRLQFFGAILPYTLLVLYFILYITIYAFDISIYHGGWYRLFWSVPIWLGSLISCFWYETTVSIKKSFLKRFANYLISILIIIVLIAITNFTYRFPSVDEIGGGSPNYRLLSEKFSTQKLKNRVALNLNKLFPFLEIQRFILQISDEGKAAFSSAYPMGLNVYPIDSNLEQALIPDFMKLPEAKNYRLYSADATFNIAWSSYFDIPLARGYLDPAISNSDRGYLFWLDAAVNVDPKKGGPGLVEGFGYPEEVAKNHAWFLIDWNAIRYFQGGSSSTYSSPINELVHNMENINEEKEVDISLLFPINLPQKLKYFEIKPQLTSPIATDTNASVVGIYGSDSGYETVVRSLAATNLNSKILIPIKLGKMLEKISSRDLESLDALILYDYDYKNKNVFNKFAEYAKQGGILIIDSGVETKESDNRKIELPEIFPFNQLERKGLGTEWDIEISKSELLNSVDIQNFSPPIFDESEWKFAYPENIETRNGEEIWITNHLKPVLTIGTLGKGKILWSGMNIFYHVSRFNNLDEGVLLKNILSNLISVVEKPLPESQVEQSKRSVTIKGQEAKGVLVKEEFYPGWKATIKTNSGVKPAKIFSAGPTYPGYMYIKLPDGIKNYSATFSFWGKPELWLLMLVSIGLIIFLFDEIVFFGFFLGRIVRVSLNYLKQYGSKWWEKDDTE